MATPCSEYPNPDDVKSIRRSIQGQEVKRKRKARRLKSITPRGNEVQAGEFSYKPINNKQKVREEIRKQKQDQRRKTERRQAVPRKTLRETSGKVNKNERTGYTEKSPIVIPLLPTVGREVHYDNGDQKVGETLFTTDFWGNPKQIHFDSEERKIGETQKGRWEGRECAVHYDLQDRIIGYSINTTDAKGRSIQKHYTPEGKHVGTTFRTADRPGKPRKEHHGFYFKSLLVSRQEERRKKQQERDAERRREALSSRFQGDIGEQEATRISMHGLSLKAVPFDKPLRTNQGMDGVFRNPQNEKLVVVEAKCTQDRSGYGLDSLGRTRHGRQGSVEWIKHKADLMQDKRSSLYSKANAKIGQEIEELGAKNVERLLIHVHPQSLNITISRGVGKDDWEPTTMFQPSMLAENKKED